MLSTITSATASVEYATEAVLQLSANSSVSPGSALAIHDLAQACVDFLLAYSKLPPGAKAPLQGAERSIE